MEESQMEQRMADYKDIPGKFRLHRIIDRESKRIVGIAAVTHWHGAAILWNIVIGVQYRRRGFGKCLMEALKHLYRRITTTYYSEEGKALVMNCGFTMELSPHYNIPQFVWVKGVNNACKDEEDGRGVPGQHSKHGTCEGNDEGKGAGAGPVA